MDTYWIPGVNQLQQYGRWAFVEFTEVFEIEKTFDILIGQFSFEASQGRKDGHPIGEKR